MSNARRTTHGDVGLDLIRMFLGVALLVRGVVFIADQSRIVALVREQGIDWLVPVLIIHYVTLAHLVGGLMLAVGLFTRVAALIQVPVLAGAVGIALQGGLLSPGQSLELSALVLFLLLVFSVYGSGKLSLDEILLARGRGGAADEQLPPRRRDIQKLIEESLERKMSQIAGLRERPSPTPMSGGGVRAEGAGQTRVASIAKYFAAAIFCVSLLAVALFQLPPAMALGDVAAIGGAALLIAAAFALFYRAAL